MAKVLHDNLTKVQARMQVYTDRKRKERNFEAEDWVFLKLQPYRQSSVAVPRNLKLSARYFGPYEVIQKIGSIAYKLRLPEGSKIHHVFHVSQLKKKIVEKVFSTQDPPHCTTDGQILTEPLKILDRHMVKKHNRVVSEVLMQWANLASEEAIWEEYSFLRSQFPYYEP
ncbi:uncharacterized protein LOC142166319 [Nicotiana tabacum]|uniref:Uncharacterized protein LOC142166319 n=1 Tax=Nicotiana tabacum TaxID=4097 RepID=A0AC58S8T6_TOBAC